MCVCNLHGCLCCQLVEVVGLSVGKILQFRMLKCIESFMAGRPSGRGSQKAARRATFKTVACIFQFFGYQRRVWWHAPPLRTPPLCGSLLHCTNFTTWHSSRGSQKPNPAQAELETEAQLEQGGGRERVGCHLFFVSFRYLGLFFFLHEEQRHAGCVCECVCVWLCSQNKHCKIYVFS